ncbi:MAG: hypothetical protein A2664_02665 [Candidatus Taylorbacteria bacterium RIFCSPHIGHO2_01_FULL_46_22b]|uniref:Uncharacterized protein n=1 Tax=Candidatus Taylorbacteria bacterium RIFCSPHIGHO2_01_FULL_46_22b TaxID=1802301 RepID=A0A1G2M3M0_9BACT|nr:MAG: hypothetical protein A2664_02665 [Candidatus Taylorbacteria bacterium RIFCSPHIGHO2_01_FULL_46_22b]
MKLKAVMSATLPIGLYKALITPTLNTWFIEEVARKCLHATEVNPAGHYIQYPDFSVPWADGQDGVEVSFSKLSASFSRSGKDFHDARLAIEAKFAWIIKHQLPIGRKCWLFVGSQTDQPILGPDGRALTLQELPYQLVQGSATPDPEQDVPCGNFALKPLGTFSPTGRTPHPILD